jgi:hypothetical protein
MAEGIVAKLRSIRAAIRSTSIAGAPLYGICVIFTFAMRLNSSAASWVAPAMLETP